MTEMKRRELMAVLGGSLRHDGLAVRRRRATGPPIHRRGMRRAVERKDVAGVVVMAADRKGVIYQGAFGVADVGEARPLRTSTRCSASRR